MKKYILSALLLYSFFAFSQSTEVGITKGNLEVSLSGAATYTVPIAVPPGINGVEPKINLTYNSQSKNGLAGYGWGISGLSAITRIPSTLHHDGVIDPVDYINDRFALDGQRLIVKNYYNYGGNNSEYQTEEFSNLKIGTNLQSTGIGFTVSYPDGSVAYYGHSEDSRSLNGWAITYWENPQGVRISYSYDKSDNYFKIMSIKYGSIQSQTPINEVKFIYGNRLLPEQAYVGNQSTALKKTLKGIEILSNNVGYKNYILVHETTVLNYERLISITEKSGDGTKQLNPITFDYGTSYNNISARMEFSESLNFDSATKRNISGDFCGGDKTDFIFYNGTNLIMYNSDPGITSNNIVHSVISNTIGFYNGVINNVFTNNILRKNVPNNSLYLHKKDGFTVIGEYKDSSTSNYFSKKFKFTSFTYDESNPNNLKFESEIIFNDPVIDYKNNYTTDFGSEPFVDKRNFISGDFDGDGVTDLIMMPIITKERYGVQISGDFFNTYFISLRKDKAPNNVKNIGLIPDLDIKFNDVSDGVLKMEVGDFNGDGKSDFMLILKDRMLIYTLNKENTAIYLLSSVNFGNNNTGARNVFLVGDYNGDGKSDIAIPKASITTVLDSWDFYISKGTSFVKLSSSIGILNYPQYKNEVITTYESGPYINPPIINEKFTTIQTMYVVNDFNSDGKADIMQYRNHVLQATKIYTSPTTYNLDESEKDTSLKSEINQATNKCDISSNLISFYIANDTRYDSNRLIGLGAVPLIVISSEKKPELFIIQKKAIYHSSSYPDGVIAPLVKITFGNGVTSSITYNYFRSNNPTLDNPYIPSFDETSFPNINIPVFFNYKLVSMIETKVNSVSKRQVFGYYGGVYNCQGLGFLGFRSISKTNWHDNTSNVISNITKFDINKRGVPIESFSRLGSFIPNSALAAGDSFISRSLITYNNENTSYVNPLLSNKIFKLQKTWIRNFNGLEETSKEIALVYNANNNLTQSITTIKKGTTTEKSVTETSSYHPTITTPYIVDRLAQKNNTVTIYPSGNATSSEEIYTYNSNLVTQIKKKGNATVYLTEDNVYDSFGNIVRKTISAPALTPRVNNFEYDTSGRFLMKNTNIEGFITNYTYNTNNGLLLTDSFPSITATGLKNTYAYDVWGKLISHKNIYDKEETNIYQNLSDGSILKTVIGDDGSSSKITLDPVGREIKIEDKDINDNWSIVDTEYDIYDRMVKKSQPHNGSATVWNEMQYDVYGRLSQTKSSGGKVTTYSYSGTTTTENDGVKSKIITKNSLDQPITITEAPGGTINYAYYANGTLKSTVCNGATISIIQDGWGNKKELIDPSAGNRKYDYNNFSELIREEVVGQGETIYDLNSVGKINIKTIKDTGGNVKSKNTYIYNASNKLIDNIRFDDYANSSFTLNSFTYDAYNNVLSTIEELNGKAKFTKIYTYDLFGRPDTETNLAENVVGGETSSRAITNEYKNGYKWKILDNDTGGTIWETNTVNAQGQVLTASLGDKIVISNTYDDYGFPIENKNDTSSTNIMTLTNYFDPIRGNLLKRSNNIFNNMLLGDWSETITYDTADRLKEYKDAVGSQTQSYNENGTIASNNIGDYAYTISGKPFQVSSITPVDQLPTSPILNYYTPRTQNITYNLFKSPISIQEVTKENIDFEYNTYNGRSVMYYGSLDTDKLLRPYRKYYSSDGTMEIKLETNSRTVEFTTYIGGDGYSAPALLRSDGTTQKMHYLHRDYQGTIVVITDDQGTVIEKRLFDVWGEMIQYQNGLDTTIPTTTGTMFIDRGYTGHEHLLGVNLINMNGRIYDFKFHRFLQPDNNIQEPSNTQNYNRYAYVMNNPTKYTDPSGESWADFFGFLFSAYVHGAQATGNANPFQWNAGQWLNVGLGAASISISNVATSSANTYLENYGKPSQNQMNSINENSIENHEYVNDIVTGHSNNESKLSEVNFMEPDHWDFDISLNISQTNQNLEMDCTHACKLSVDNFFKVNNQTIINSQWLTYVTKNNGLPSSLILKSYQKAGYFAIQYGNSTFTSSFNKKAALNFIAEQMGKGRVIHLGWKPSIDSPLGHASLINRIRYMKDFSQFRIDIMNPARGGETTLRGFSDIYSMISIWK